MPKRANSKLLLRPLRCSICKELGDTDPGAKRCHFCRRICCLRCSRLVALDQPPKPSRRVRACDSCAEGHQPWWKEGDVVNLPADPGQRGALRLTGVVEPGGRAVRLHATACGELTRILKPLTQAWRLLRSSVG